MGKDKKVQSATAMNPTVQRASNGADGFRLRVGGGALAAGRARRELSSLRTDLDAPLLESVRLLVTELVTNSVRHADAAAVDIAVLVGRERVHVEIANQGASFQPAPPEEMAATDSGWGLFLVDRISDAWGVVDDEAAGHQRVWFELARA